MRTQKISERTRLSAASEWFLSVAHTGCVQKLLPFFTMFVFWGAKLRKTLWNTKFLLMIFRKSPHIPLDSVQPWSICWQTSKTLFRRAWGRKENAKGGLGRANKAGLRRVLYGRYKQRLIVSRQPVFQNLNLIPWKMLQIYSVGLDYASFRWTFFVFISKNHHFLCAVRRRIGKIRKFMSSNGRLRATQRQGKTS